MDEYAYRSPRRNALNTYPTCDAKRNKIPLRFMRVNLMFMYHVRIRITSAYVYYTYIK